uniref:Uncharacterized protein n=1 Tax=Panagrolaimus sp. ES5 TaxID=591445 RepID=A0AC34FS27_9BILA
MHAIDIICQVIRFSPPAATYMYMNCEVQDDQHPGVRHGFAFKLNKVDFDQVKGIQPGDVVCLKRPYRAERERRASNGYNLRTTDMNVQLESWEESAVEILYSIHSGEVTKFDLLKLPRSNICVRGFVEYVPRTEVSGVYMMMIDGYENLLKIKLPQLIDVKKTDEIIVRGSLCVKGKIVFVDAVKWDVVPVPKPATPIDPPANNRSIADPPTKKVSAVGSKA